MTQTGDSFCQNDVRDRLAVSDDAVEVKNQCTRHFNSGEDQRFACLICGLASKWTDAPESSRTLSVAWCVNQALPVRPPSACLRSRCDRDSCRDRASRYETHGRSAGWAHAVAG